MRQAAMKTLLKNMVVALALVVALGGVAQKKQTIKSAKNEKSATQKRISEASKKLSDNQKRTEQSLQQLNLLRGEIDQKETQISSTKREIEVINEDIKAAEDSIMLLDAKLNALRDAYTKALRRLQSSRSFTDELSYIFSSKSFTEAFARIRYVKEFGKWRKRKAEEISRAAENIRMKKERLSQLQSQRKSSLDLLSNDQAQLKARQDEAGRMVTRLQADGRSLQQAIEKERQRLRTIDSEITRMIEEERREKQRKEAERKERERKEMERKAREEQKRKDAEKRRQQNNQQKDKTAPSQKPTPAEQSKPTPPPAPPTAPKATINNSDPDAAMTRRFEAARGSMLFPVASPYRIIGKFGSADGQPNSTGIEIILDGADNARAIFDGTVSRIFQNHDGNYSVMVRHGAYITVYYNISSLAVKAGSPIKAGQSVGRVGVDPRYGKPMLHFEIRKGSQTLNPQQWVK